jgi:hypothetical protein
VAKRGEYGKRGRRITSPVTRVPPDLVPEPDTPEMRAHESSDGLRLTRGQTWGLSLFVASTLVVLGTVTYFAISRAAAIDHHREQIEQLEQRIDHLELKQQVMERKQVQIQTKLESMR